MLHHNCKEYNINIIEKEYSPAKMGEFCASAS